jgi:hypothetical protein
VARAGALRLHLAGRGRPGGALARRRLERGRRVATFYTMYHLEPVGRTSSRCAARSRVAHGRRGAGQAVRAQARHPCG